MFEQTVELPAVQRTPGTVEVVPGLRLLPRVVVVLELENRGRAYSGVSIQLLFAFSKIAKKDGNARI